MQSVQRWQEQGERGKVFPCPIRAAIAGCRSFSGASSVQEEHRGNSLYGFQGAKESRKCENPSLLPSVDASLVSFLPSSALNSVCCCQSESRLWKCGGYSCVWVCFSQCMRASPSCSMGDRGQVPWIARSLLPLPSLIQSLYPPPCLPSLSWHQHSGDCCQNTSKVVKILGGYWIENEGLKRHRTVVSESSHGRLPPPEATRCCRCKKKHLKHFSLSEVKLESSDIWLVVPAIRNESGKPEVTKCEQWTRKLSFLKSQRELFRYMIYDSAQNNWTFSYKQLTQHTVSLTGSHTHGGQQLPQLLF